MLNVTHGVILSFEEYSTRFAPIEAALNSRPICHVDVHEQGTEALTPRSFLIVRSVVAMPKIYDKHISLTNRLLLIQNQVRGFWSSWSKAYINQLHQRVKWQSKQPNLVPGQLGLVLIQNENTKPFVRPLGSIIKVHPGVDGCVRAADVKFQRAVKNFLFRRLLFYF